MSDSNLPGEIPAETQKRHLAEARAEAMRQSAELALRQERAKAEMEAKIAAAKAEMEAQLAAMRAELEPLQRQISQMNEAIWAVDLYLGRNEEIVSLRDPDTHATAPADEPLCIRQDVLSMDEETAAHGDLATRGGIDARNLDVFDAWIADPANLDRVLPEKRGIVALVPRRRGRDYKDPWMNQAMAEANETTYWLIRNGERLFRMSTDFTVGKRLIPAVDEFTGLFVSRRYDHTSRQDIIEPLTPGTKEWDEAVERQGARERHFMRMALILQGLIDRTTVFHPLPAAPLNLLDQRTYDDGRAVLIRDAEALLTDGRPDFFTWLAERNNHLRTGMRIVGAFNTDIFRRAGGEHDGESWSGNDRLTPARRDRYEHQMRPTTGALYRLESKRTIAGSVGFVFKFDRGTYSDWVRGELVEKTMRRGSCTVLPSDAFVIPVDLVSIEDCTYYLNARTQRRDYEHMVPLLRAVIAAKEAERAEEEPFRGLIAQALIGADADLAAATASDPDLTAAHAVVDQLVDWWKIKNKHHRALSGATQASLARGVDPDSHEAKALREILTEHAARRSQQATRATTSDRDARNEQRIVADLLAADPTIMVIGRKRDGSYLAFAPQPRACPAAAEVGAPATNRTQPPPLTDEERAAASKESGGFNKPAALQNQIFAAVTDNVWAREYTTSKTGRSIKTRDWISPGNRLDGATILHTSEAWASFNVHADPNEHLTDPEIEAVIAEIVPEVEQTLRDGWPTWKTTEDPMTPLILGVCLRSDPGDYDEGPRFEVHYANASDAEPFESTPAATGPTYLKMAVQYAYAPFTKTRNGITLDRDSSGHLRRRQTSNGSTYSSASAGRPWHYFWSGRARHAIALVEYPQNTTRVDARAEAIEAHNRQVGRLQSLAREPLHHAFKAATAANERATYEAFIAEYIDPALWPTHRKNLPKDYFEPAWHPHGRYLPKSITALLRAAMDAGLVEVPADRADQSGDRFWARVPGHTIGSLAEHLGITLVDGETREDKEAIGWGSTVAAFRDLPLHPEPEADSEIGPEISPEIGPEPVTAPVAESEPREGPKDEPAAGSKIEVTVTDADGAAVRATIVEAPDTD